jgi:hypothetical protein
VVWWKRGKRKDKGDFMKLPSLLLRKWQHYSRCCIFVSIWINRIEWNEAERNEVKWNENERNGINLSFYCLDILKKRNKIEGKKWYEIKFISSYYIPFRYYFSNPNNGTLFYFIPSYSINQYIRKLFT